MEILNKFRDEFYKNNDGAVIVISEENRFYLSGFESSDGIVLITPSMSALIVDFRYYEMAKRQITGLDIYLSEGPLFKFAKKFCDKAEVKTIHLEDDYITVSMQQKITKLFEGYNIEYLGGFVSKMRSVKTESEIERIKDAQAITDSAFEHIINFIRPGITENDIAIELDMYMRKCGAQGSAFKTIAVSGAKSSLPHGEPSSVLITENSFLTMDFGAKLRGYCADMTRTVVVGKADDEMKKIYGIVLEAQLAALECIKANVIGSEVDRAARDIITKAGYGENFGHSTGHGLGIEVHESPSYSPNYNLQIPQNAVLSIEPGIYIEGKYGVRIEDIAVVGADGPLILTSSSKKILEIT